jgi:hypothetical protein
MRKSREKAARLFERMPQELLIQLTGNSKEKQRRKESWNSKKSWKLMSRKGRLN